MDADEETRSLLRTYGEANTPSPQARERAWASLAAATAAPTGPGAPPAPTSALGWKLGIALGALAVGGVALVLGLRGGAAPSSDSAPAASASTSAASGPPPTAPTVSSLVQRQEEPPVAEPPGERVEAPSGEASPSSPRTIAAPRARERAEASADGDAPAEPATLGEELRLLRLARSSLSAGDSDAALRALQDHEARFPAGVLAAERDVTRVLVLCETGRRAEARALASGRGAPAMARALTRCESEPQP